MTSYDAPKQTHFSTKYLEILNKVDAIDPVAYGSTRNYIDGRVSRLSPYISRGVISTKYILKSVLAKGYSVAKIEKFIQELAWRDYWQQVWIAKGDAINFDLKRPQEAVHHYEMPRAIVEGKTGIEAIDKAIAEFYEHGYLHNHIRMYVAALCSTIGKSHWKVPAQWMYYYLLDADWASNALSWQWVAGSNSNKQYVANQENINKYCHTEQANTFLDISYDAFKTLAVPKELSDVCSPKLTTKLPEQKHIHINWALPTLVYNFYNLDPQWNSNLSANRVLLLEPSHFKKYPVSEKSIDFMISLAQNIENIQVYVGEFDSFISEFQIKDVYFKEHPLNKNYKGNEVPRDWMFSLTGYYPSFFAFWKKCKKELNY